MLAHIQRHNLEMRAVIERIAAGTLRPLAASLAAYYGLIAISHQYFLHPPAAAQMSAIAAASFAIFVAIFLRARSISLTRRSQAMITAMAAIVMANSLAHIFLTADPKQTSNVALAMLGAGLLFYSGRWLAAYLSASFALWLIISSAWPPEADRAHYVFMLLSAAVLAALTFVVRMRGLALVEGMRGEVREAELEARLQHLQKAESLGVLAGGVAHDLNNALVGVLGNADLAARALPLDSEAIPYLEAVNEAGQRASQLASRMLDYSGKGRYVSEYISLPMIVASIKGLLRASAQGNIEIAIEIGEETPTVEGDPTQIQQVILNLVTNASEAIGDQPGRILIRIERSEPGCGGDEASHRGLPQTGVYAQVKVEDNGCGMDGPTRARMFDPFYTTKRTGRGLGLATVSGIVRAHGGSLLVDSQPGRGSSITVLLPAAPSAPQPSHAHSSPTQLAARTVLVADGETSSRWLARDILRGAGFLVLEAKNGLELIDRLRAVRGAIDLVLLDASIPVFTSLQVVEETGDFPVNVVLMSEDPDALPQGYTGKPKVFLRKPFTSSELLLAARQALT